LHFADDFDRQNDRILDHVRLFVRYPKRDRHTPLILSSIRLLLRKANTTID